MINSTGQSFGRVVFKDSNLNERLLSIYAWDIGPTVKIKYAVK